MKVASKWAAMIGGGVVVALTLVALAIALPRYLDRLRVSNRQEAQRYMMTVAQEERQALTSGRCYVNLVTLGVVPPDTVRDAYSITLDTGLLCASPPHFRLTLTPRSGQAPDRCGTLALDDAGQRSATRADGAVEGCW